MKKVKGWKSERGRGEKVKGGKSEKILTSSVHVDRTSSHLFTLSPF